MKTIRIIALAGIFAMLVSGIAMAASKDNLTFTKDTPASDNNVTPAEVTINGANLVYAYMLPCNGSLSDTLHVTFTLVDGDSTTPESFNISFSTSGDTSAITATPPATFSITDNGITVKKDILISASSLAPGDYMIDINMSGPSSSAVDWPNPKKIQVMIHVNECTASAPSCFFTDSEGDFLADCNGELVSTNEGGTFILVNKKNGNTVATNPGQFYYNYLWTNSGEALDVKILLDAPMNLAPKGANAVHAYTFGPSGFTQSVEAFDMVNNDGTPCGPDGPCTVHVGAGETLWVTWHLAYDGVGSSHPEAGYSCPGEEEIEASVHLVNASTYQEVAGACTTNATGYNKN
jgi:hypothetical protein